MTYLLPGPEGREFERLEGWRGGGWKIWWANTVEIWSGCWDWECHGAFLRRLNTVEELEKTVGVGWCLPSSGSSMLPCSCMVRIFSLDAYYLLSLNYFSISQSIIYKKMIYLTFFSIYSNKLLNCKNKILFLLFYFIFILLFF